MDAMVGVVMVMRISTVWDRVGCNLAGTEAH